MSQDQPINNASTSRSRWICLALAIFTVALYAPALRCQFIAFDDPVYVTENQHVQAGFTSMASPGPFALRWSATGIR